MHAQPATDAALPASEVAAILRRHDSAEARLRALQSLVDATLGPAPAPTRELPKDRRGFVLIGRGVEW